MDGYIDGVAGSVRQPAAVELLDVLEALRDERVVRSLERALRDARIRRSFRRLRRAMTVAEACAVLAEQCALSPERIKSIVYERWREGVHR